MTGATKERRVMVNGDAILDALDNIIAGFQVIRAQVARRKTEVPAMLAMTPQHGAGEAADRRGHIPTTGTAAAAERGPLASGGAVSNLGKGAHAVLVAIAQRGDKGATHAAIAIVTGYKERTRYTYLQRLASFGLVEHRGERFVATAEGIEAAGPLPVLPTGVALQNHWIAELPEGESQCFAAIANGRATNVDALISVTDYAERTVYTYMQRLVARDLVTKANGVYALAGELRDG